MSRSILPADWRWRCWSGRRSRACASFRTIFYLPSVLAGVAFVVVWVWLLNPRGGLLNLLLSQVGIQGPNWLNRSGVGFICAGLDEFLGVGPVDGDLPIWVDQHSRRAARSRSHRRREYLAALHTHHFPTAFTDPFLHPDPERHQSHFKPSPTRLSPPTAGPSIPPCFLCCTSTGRLSNTSIWAMPPRWPGCCCYSCWRLTVVILRTQHFWVHYLGGARE